MFIYEICNAILLGVTSLCLNGQVTLDISADAGVSGKLREGQDQGNSVFGAEDVGLSHRATASFSYLTTGGKNAFSAGVGYASYSTQRKISGNSLTWPSQFDQIGFNVNLPGENIDQIENIYRIYSIEVPVVYRRYFMNGNIRPYAEALVAPALRINASYITKVSGENIDSKNKNTNKDNELLLFTGLNFGVEFQLGETLRGFSQLQGRGNLIKGALSSPDDFWDAGVQVGIRMGL